MAAVLRGILNPRARREKMYSEGRDLPWRQACITGERRGTGAQYKISVKAHLQQAVQVATVTEHTAAAYRDPFTVVHLGKSRDVPSLARLRARVDTGTETYNDNDLGRHMDRDTSAPMEAKARQK